MERQTGAGKALATLLRKTQNAMMTHSTDSNVIIDEEGLPYAPAFDDHYFSRHDGRAETAHVFIAGNGLPERWQTKQEFVIGELGFGTGLNFIETWFQWKETRSEGQSLKFVSVEAFPLPKETAATALETWPELSELSQILLDQWDAVHSPLQLDDQTHLHVLNGDVTEKISEFPMIDAWYLDGFAPAKNPQMWSEELMQAMAKRTNTAGTFASYTAAGWVRRNLEASGFLVEKRPGFGTKRDMISGHKL